MPRPNMPRRPFGRSRNTHAGDASGAPKSVKGRACPTRRPTMATSPDISPVCGIMAERFCPRFVLATKDVVGATSAGARANLGQNIQPESAKRTVVQTATLDTGDIFMTINEFHANESVLVKYPG